MQNDIKTINLGGANCYLVKTNEGFVMIDTGFPFKRAALEKELDEAGCKPGNLKLVILTHGDSDHIGNCRYLRDKYGAKTAMHKSDSEMAEYGDMLRGRQFKNAPGRIIAGILMSLPMIRLKKSDRFKPDIFVEDGYDLSSYGFDAKVLHIPGHSKGSIGVLAGNGDLFCGDLLGNMKKPGLFSMIDDMTAAKSSLERLKGMDIKIVYPGHGKPFQMKQINE